MHSVAPYPDHKTVLNAGPPTPITPAPPPQVLTLIIISLLKITRSSSKHAVVTDVALIEISRHIFQLHCCSAVKFYKYTSKFTSSHSPFFSIHLFLSLST